MCRYLALRMHVLVRDQAQSERERRPLSCAGLRRCHLPNGRVVWLCEQHYKLPALRASVLESDSDTGDGGERPGAQYAAYTPAQIDEEALKRFGLLFPRLVLQGHPTGGSGSSDIITGAGAPDSSSSSTGTGGGIDAKSPSAAPQAASPLKTTAKPVELKAEASSASAKPAPAPAPMVPVTPSPRQSTGDPTVSVERARNSSARNRKPNPGDPSLSRPSSAQIQVSAACSIM